MYESSLVTFLAHSDTVTESGFKWTGAEYYYAVMYLCCFFKIDMEENIAPSFIAAYKHESAAYKCCHGNYIYVLHIPYNTNMLIFLTTN